MANRTRSTGGNKKSSNVKNKKTDVKKSKNKLPKVPEKNIPSKRSNKNTTVIPNNKKGSTQKNNNSGKKITAPKNDKRNGAVSKKPIAKKRIELKPRTETPNQTKSFIPIQRRTSDKSKKRQTIYRNEKGKFISGKEYYSRFKNHLGEQLTTDEISAVQTTALADTEGRNVYDILNQLNKKRVFGNKNKQREFEIAFGLMDEFMLDKLDTGRSKLTGAKMMQYVSTVKGDAVQAVKDRFKSNIDVLDVRFSMSTDGKAKDTMKLGDTVTIMIYRTSKKVKKSDRMGTYEYSISTGKIIKSED